MSKLPDEQWDMIEDSISKKRTAPKVAHKAKFFRAIRINYFSSPFDADQYMY